MKLNELFHVSRDTLLIGKPGDKIGFHVDTPWNEDCVQYGAAAGIYIHLAPFGCLQISLPSLYEMKFDDANTCHTEKVPWHWPKFSYWSFRGGYRMKLRSGHIVFRPNKRWQCDAPINEWIGRDGKPRSDVCGAFRWHRGLHAGQLPATWFETTPSGRKNSLMFAIKTS